MVVFPITDEQAVWLIQQLPVERRAAVLLELLRDMEAGRTLEGAAERDEIIAWFEERGLIWSVSDEERVARYMAMVTQQKLRRLTDPEIILSESLRKQKEEQIRSRDAAVQVITHKNYLRGLVEEQERAQDTLEAELAAARAADDSIRVEVILKQREAVTNSLARLRRSLVEAEESAEAVKNAIRDEELAFRLRTAQSLALKYKLAAEPLPEQMREYVDLLTGGIDRGSWEANLDRVADRLRELEQQAKGISAWLDQQLSRPEEP